MFEIYSYTLKTRFLALNIKMQSEGFTAVFGDFRVAWCTNQCRTVEGRYTPVMSHLLQMRKIYIYQIS